MAKPFILGLALILLMAFVVACGSSEESETTQETSEQTTTTTTGESTTEAMVESTEEAPAQQQQAGETPQAQQEQQVSQEQEQESQEQEQEPQEEQQASQEQESGQATSEAPTEVAIVAREDLDAALVAEADARSGGPGAFYLGDGDLSILVGAAPTPGEGNAEGIVPLSSIENHQYVYESDYYRSVIERANFVSPTALTSTGESIVIQHACVNRALVFCKIVENFLAPRVEERTNGQLMVVPSSFPELGIAGPDSLALVRDGTLDMVSVLGVYVAGELPELEIQSIFGIYSEREQQFEATVNLDPFLRDLLEENSAGGKVIGINWHNGDDIFLFTKEPLNVPSDFAGMKTRAFGTSISDWIRGMGGEAQFLAFAEVYTALERGILEAGVTGGDAGHGQRWYEVVSYINGPLTSWPSSHNVINGDLWDSIPADLQAILLEESARMELEALRLGSIQNELGLQKNIDAGLGFIQFGPEMSALSDMAVTEHVLPNWVGRVGGPEEFFVQEVFNNAIGSVVGITVGTDGTITREQ